MSNFGAQITFLCDKCRKVMTTIPLRHAGSESFDLAGVEEELADRDWTKDGSDDVCPNCSKGESENEL